ncbi:hypothetical protein [Carboxylicivirga caseinilyticus]|uniref:hypothetical protein n=1 Tax=Carboxylicivirga caseinilyticus TaxID=3417572 RepID=UPI003D3536C7|nr:hypothetical protein [Marinilabiliaceae bacterium A049]
MKYFFVILWLFLIPVAADAIFYNARAFVVSNDNDTIMGEVRLNWFNEASGAVYFNSFDKETLHYEVWFRPAGLNTWKAYAADELKMFSFQFQGQTYAYKSFNLDKRSLHKCERNQHRFLLLKFSGSVELYQDKIRIYNIGYKGLLSNTYYTYVDYYLYSEAEGLIRAEKSKEVKNIRDLLIQYGIESEFIKSFSGNINFKRLPEILHEYSQWKKEVRV